MRRDAIELDRFYRTTRGMLAQRMIERRLSAIWPNLKDLDVLGLGYATPYLRDMQASARRCIDLMPSAQGAIAPGSPSRIVMGDETRMPFPEAMFDRVLMIHMLEEAEHLPGLLRETWRVMAPEWRVVIATAARAGVWALSDATPFGHGRPFSRGQLTQLLDDALFEPVAWSRALYAPPWRWASGKGIAGAWEKAGEKFWPGLGGLILVEAVKRTNALRPLGRAARNGARALDERTRPALSPQQINTDLRSEKGASHDDRAP